MGSIMADFIIAFAVILLIAIVIFILSGAQFKRNNIDNSSEKEYNNGV